MKGLSNFICTFAPRNEYYYNQTIKMKYLKLCIIFLLMGLSKMNAQSGKLLVIEKQNGTAMSFILKQKPELSFSNHMLHISLNGNITNLEIGDVKQFYFVDESLSIKENRVNSTFKISYLSNDKVQIEGVSRNDQVHLFSIDGVQYSNCVRILDNSAEISFTPLPKGTYVINISQKQSFKINRK